MVIRKKPSRKYRLDSQSFLFKVLFWLILSLLAVGFALLIIVSYRDYINPKNVHGSWIEIGAPSHLTEVLTFNEQGVFRDHRLIATQFEFDGKTIAIRTGTGETLYQLSGTTDSPQLRRVEPPLPHQRFIRAGYEHTISTEPGPSRRSAVSEHFRER